MRALSCRLRRHGLTIVVSAIFAGLTLNVWRSVGVWPVLILLAAAAGLVLVLGSVGLVTGSQVAKHSLRTRAAIEAGNYPPKELTK